MSRAPTKCVCWFRYGRQGALRHASTGSFHTSHSKEHSPLTTKRDLLPPTTSLNLKPPALKNSVPIAESALPPQIAPGTQLTNPKKDTDNPRLPRNVSSVYIRPLRREAEHNVPTCDLQMRSYNAQNLDLFTDFALRAAYYCGLPAFGPVPLPRITERWTVPRGQFVHKKAQENFERITMRRLIQIKDGHPETVQVWLAFLRKHAYYGIGMKANVWEYNALGVGKRMEKDMERDMEDVWTRIGPGKDMDEKLTEFINRENAMRAAGYNAPMARP